MSNFTSTIEYKFKVTNNLDKVDAQQKKFNFYLGLPYSKRKYRYMQVVNFATNKEGQHLFNVILGHSESSVAAMSDDILRNERSAFKPAVTKVSRITYASVNVGQVAVFCNPSNKEIFEGADWTGISGEYMKIKSFKTNGNDDVIGLIFDAADRNVVSARKNDNTNVVAKPDIVKVPQLNEFVIDIVAQLWKTHQKLIGDYDALRKANQELEQKVEDRDQIISDLKAHIADDDNSIQKQYELIQGYMVTVKDLEEKLKISDETLEYLRKDLEARDKDISELMNQLEEKDRQIGELEKANSELHQQMEYWEEYIAELKRENEVQGDQLEQMEDHVNELGSKPDETQKTFRDKYIDRVVDEFRRRAEALSDEELLTLMKGSNA